jgi:hypothetical protein
MDGGGVWFIWLQREIDNPEDVRIIIRIVYRRPSNKEKIVKSWAELGEQRWWWLNSAEGTECCNDVRDIAKVGR